jgi:hypothetical protein
VENSYGIEAARRGLVRFSAVFGNSGLMIVFTISLHSSLLRATWTVVQDSALRRRKLGKWRGNRAAELDHEIQFTSPRHISLRFTHIFHSFPVFSCLQIFRLKLCIRWRHSPYPTSPVQKFTRKTGTENTGQDGRIILKLKLRNKAWTGFILL